MVKRAPRRDQFVRNWHAARAIQAKKLGKSFTGYARENGLNNITLSKWVQRYRFKEKNQDMLKLNNSEKPDTSKKADAENKKKRVTRTVRDAVAPEQYVTQEQMNAVSANQSKLFRDMIADPTADFEHLRARMRDIYRSRNVVTAISLTSLAISIIAVLTAMGVLH